MTFGYSNDGARDLVEYAWPAAASAGFANEGFYGNNVGFTQRDEAGNITSMADPAGQRSLFYEKNRLTETDWFSGELNPYKVVREYDANGRALQVTLQRNGAPLHGVSLGYTGASGEISGVTTNGFAAGISRDATSRHVTGFTRGAVTQAWTRGTAGRITAANTAGTVSGAPTFSYSTFDTKGRRLTVNTNKGNWTYGYRNGANGDGQLASADSTGNDLGDFAYNFDGIGRRVDFAGNVANALNQFVAIEHALAPKNLYISADPDARLWVNGTEMTPFAGGWIYPLGHPGAAGGWVPWTAKGVLEDAGDTGAFPDAVAEFSGSVFFPPTSETFTFDADGNRESSALWNYGWDGRNKLVRARTKTWNTAPQGWDVKFDYDAEGRRFRKEVTRYHNGNIAEQKVIHFVWDGWDLLYERHQDIHGNFLMDRKYVWGPDIADGAAGGAGGLLLIRETRGTTTNDYYPLFDGTGHVTGLADNTGKLVAEYWWGPFGELIAAKGEMADANPFRFATKYFDAETGLYYFGHRYYDPTTGQWMNREPLGEEESLNLYSYCHNDPVNKVDRLGLDSVSIEMEGAAGFIAYYNLELWSGRDEGLLNIVKGPWIKKTKKTVRLGPIFGSSPDDWRIQLEPWVGGPDREVNFSSLAALASKEGRYNANYASDSDHHFHVIQQLYASNWKPMGNPSDFLAGAADQVFSPFTAAANLISGGGAYTISGALRRDGFVDFNENTFSYHAGGESAAAAECLLLAYGVGKQGVGRPVMLLDDFASQPRAGLPKGITFDANVHRAVDPKYINTAFDFHAASNLRASHRYTDVGRGGIYSGTSREAVLGELAHYGVDPSKAAWVTSRVRVENVLDLTNPAVRTQLGVKLDQITGDSYFYTHALGDFARGQGYGGILFPSARAPGTSNFVEFINHAR